MDRQEVNPSAPKPSTKGSVETVDAEGRSLLLNQPELSILIAALRGHMRQIGATDLHELNFADGLRNRLIGLMRDKQDPECWCPCCGWRGANRGDLCGCGSELRVCRGGVKTYEARGSTRKAAQEARR